MIRKLTMDEVIELVTSAPEQSVFDWKSEFPLLQKSTDEARGALKEAVAILGRLGSNAAGGKYDDAAREYRNYNHFITVGVQPAVGRAEPWSLFNPAVRDAHYAAMRRQLELK